jgi:phenylacetate-CoA ligase
MELPRRSKVRLIIVAGEPGGSIPATRQRIEQLWPGARVFDHHGMTEIGPVTYQCPAKPSLLHVLESGFIAEILKADTTEPVPCGTAGELVLTNLGRTGSPLLRYRTGDLVKAAIAPVCACGRSELALEGGILGRVDDMVVIRGVNVYPTAVEEIVRGCGDVAEYQVHVSHAGALAEMRIEVEPSPTCRDISALLARLENSFEACMALRVPLQAVPAGTLPRFEMKAKRWTKD